MEQSPPSGATEFISIVVRLLGLSMLVIGLFIGVKVILEAKALYDQPQRIERFANAIEQGSHLDSLFTSFTERTLGDETNDEPVLLSERKKHNVISITYFLAWFLALILLMVIGGLASSAIKAGGQLALYDLQVKRFARQLIEEVRKTDN